MTSFADVGAWGWLIQFFVIVAALLVANLVRCYVPLLRRTLFLILSIIYIAGAAVDPVHEKRGREYAGSELYSFISKIPSQRLR